MNTPPRIKPTVILPDTSPLVHLAAADALPLLNALGRVVVVDVAAAVAVATTRNMLELAQREGIIPDAEAVWSRIADAAPTANPASVISYINTAKP